VKDYFPLTFEKGVKKIKKTRRPRPLTKAQSSRRRKARTSQSSELRDGKIGRRGIPRDGKRRAGPLSIEKIYAKREEKTREQGESFKSIKYAAAENKKRHRKPVSLTRGGLQGGRFVIRKNQVLKKDTQTKKCNYQGKGQKEEYVSELTLGK